MLYNACRSLMAEYHCHINKDYIPIITKSSSICYLAILKIHITKQKFGDKPLKKFCDFWLTTYSQEKNYTLTDAIKTLLSRVLGSPSLDPNKQSLLF